MSLRTMLKDLASDRGVEIDEDELDQLGLADEVTPTTTAADGVLSQPLPGRAAGSVELFLGADTITQATGTEKDGLMWYPIIREGQWAVRPSTTGQKRRLPLRVVAGKSTNQRREIGLQDLLAAHEAQAVQHVTVPLSHANTLPENQGFVDKMRIVDGKVKDQRVKVLLGGYRVTEPDTKGKMERGTYANRSAGILYDYVNTETGVTYPAVIEHVALTNKPWITGMVSFGRKLKDGTADPVNLDTVSMRLSDDGPDDDGYALALTDELDLDDQDRDFLAVAGAAWDQTTSPNWLKGQINSQLRTARQKKMQASSAPGINGTSVTSPLAADIPPNYQCLEAKPGSALVADGYDDDANTWVVPTTIQDGAVQMPDFGQWQATKKVHMPDDRPAPPKSKMPLADDVTPKLKTRLELAREDRRARSAPASASKPTAPNNPREVVEQMAGESTHQLSEEAQRAIQAAEARAKAAEDKATKLSEKLDRVTGTVQSNEVDNYVRQLASDEANGLGLSEERGFGGVLAEIRQLMLADDGEPACQADHFAQDGNTSGELTLSESLKRVFVALAKATEGKKRLGEQLSQPADATKVSDAEKPADGTDGKPAVGEVAEGDKLSTEQQVTKVVEGNPAIARVLGRRPTTTASGSGS